MPNLCFGKIDVSIAVRRRYCIRIASHISISSLSSHIQQISDLEGSFLTEYRLQVGILCDLGSEIEWNIGNLVSILICLIPAYKGILTRIVLILSSSRFYIGCRTLRIVLGIVINLIPIGIHIIRPPAIT